MEPVSAIATTTDTAQTTSNAAVSSSLLTSDFEFFLEMLTTQARYQDPLEPMDSSEYAAQLAQFSMVEQQVQTNELMEEMLFAIGVSESVNLASWIGLDALTAGTGYFNGGPVKILPEPAADAEEMFLVVRDVTGNAVLTRQLPVSADPVFWDGKNVNGDTMPPGEYTFEIESRAGGEIMLVEQAMSYARVVESRIDDGNMRFVLESGRSVGASEVYGLQEPG